MFQIVAEKMSLKTKLNGITLLLGCCFIVISILIYVFLRTTDIPIVRFADDIGLRNASSTINASSFPVWIRFSLPDGLWLLSYEMFVSILWKYNCKSKYYLCFCLFLPAFAIVCELFQINGIVRGTFDMADIICYFFATILGISHCITFNYILYGKEK